MYEKQRASVLLSPTSSQVRVTGADISALPPPLKRSKSELFVRFFLIDCAEDAKVNLSELFVEKSLLIGLVCPKEAKKNI